MDSDRMALASGSRNYSVWATDERSSTFKVDRRRKSRTVETKSETIFSSLVHPMKIPPACTFLEKRIRGSAHQPGKPLVHLFRSAIRTNLSFSKLSSRTIILEIWTSAAVLVFSVLRPSEIQSRCPSSIYSVLAKKIACGGRLLSNGSWIPAS